MEQAAKDVFYDKVLPFKIALNVRYVVKDQDFLYLLYDKNYLFRNFEKTLRAIYFNTFYKGMTPENQGLFWEIILNCFKDIIKLVLRLELNNMMLTP